MSTTETPLREAYIPAEVGDLAVLETPTGWLLGRVARHTKPGRIMFLNVGGEERRVKDSDYTRLAPLRQCDPAAAQELLAARGKTPYANWIEARDDLAKIRLKT